MDHHQVEKFILNLESKQVLFALYLLNNGFKGKIDWDKISDIHYAEIFQHKSGIRKSEMVFINFPIFPTEENRVINFVKERLPYDERQLFLEKILRIRKHNAKQENFENRSDIFKIELCRKLGDVYKAYLLMMLNLHWEINGLPDVLH